MKGNNTEISQRILYEDNHLVIVNKLPSEIVQGDKTGDVPLSEVVKDYIRVKYNKPGEAFLGVVHRLDRPVSGAVIFARTSKALARMNAILHDRKIEKKYWAIVKDSPPRNEDTLINYLKKNEEKNKSFVSNSDLNGALRCELRYILIGKSDKYSLLEVELMTGRHHQIRAQLSHIGCPIKGDLKYGYPRSNPDASISLHSRSIKFLHPVSQVEVYVLAPPPDEALWNFFSNQ
ncbi:MAG: RNA pseudouridine synthase [Bacteroidota bacterium]